MSVAGFELKYTVAGSEDPNAMERLVAAFERGGEELRDFGKYLWPRLTPALERAMEDQLDAEGAGPSGSWAPLSAQYAAWKQANYPGAPILQRTRAMYEGLTSSGSPWAERRTDGDSYGFGTRGVTYASYHQTGTARMPSRPPFDLGAGFETEMSRIGALAARDALKQARIDEFADLSDLGSGE